MINEQDSLDFIIKKATEIVIKTNPLDWWDGSLTVRS